jgi:glutathione S-transferase
VVNNLASGELYVLPILYSFRRCPYAMRARFALKINNIPVELREIRLNSKPAAMLACSPKGTVPVLKLSSGEVIDESLDIMMWAFSQSSPSFLLNPTELLLIQTNDGPFKIALDNYKYADTANVHAIEYYRSQGEQFLQQLNNQLLKQPYLMGMQPSFTDWAIFPFVRQFTHVDKTWFAATTYEPLKKWLVEFEQSPLFEYIMQKIKPWQANESGVSF